jgi:hypothetical protein
VSSQEELTKTFHPFLIAVIVIFFLSERMQAQTAVIGIIDLYGLRKIPPTDIRRALKIKVGDSLDLDKLSKKDILEPLLAVPGVKKADIGLVCCDGKEGKWIMYVGISENARDFFSYNPTPHDSVNLPAEILKTYRKFDSAFAEAIQKGDNGEDDSQGHMMMNNTAARAFQKKYIGYALNDLPILRKVLHYSAIGEQRAIAAQLIAYAKDKKEVVVDLLYAVHDSNDEVRNNATRALGVIAGYANQKPELGIQIPGADFIQMINSLVWTDRNKGILVLASLTQQRDSVLLQQLRNEALPSLTEMARWEAAGHAGPAYFILGRMAGYDDEKITTQFSSDRRNIFLQEILAKIH